MGNATLKLWLLDSFDENGVPLCLRSMKLFEKIEEETLTTLAVNEPSHLLLFGCASGRIYSLFGDLLRTKKIAPIALPPNFTTPITCLAISTPLSVLFPRGSHSQDANHLVVFVATQSRLGSYAFPLEPKKPAVFQALDDAAGCAANCGCVDKSGNFVEPRCGCEVDGGSRGRSVRVLRDGARAKLSAGGIEAVCVLASRQRGVELAVCKAAVAEFQIDPLQAQSLRLVNRDGVGEFQWKLKKSPDLLLTDHLFAADAVKFQFIFAFRPSVWLDIDLPAAVQ